VPNSSVSCSHLTKQNHACSFSPHEKEQPLSPLSLIFFSLSFPNFSPNFSPPSLSLFLFHSAKGTSHNTLIHFLFPFLSPLLACSFFIPTKRNKLWVGYHWECRFVRVSYRSRPLAVSRYVCSGLLGAPG